MGNVKITTNKNRVKFNPIKVNIEFSIDSSTELRELKNEFEEGVLQEFTTSYSVMLYDIFDELRDTVEKL